MPLLPPALLACISIALGTPPGAVSIPAAQVDGLLAHPTGSLSVGATSGGGLTRPVHIKARGPGWRFLGRVRSRKTGFGTDEMARLVEHLGAAAGQAIDVPVSLGNISLRPGGRSPWHRSHQAGRDIDILYYARDARGRLHGMKTFQRFGANLRTADGAWRFDVPKNLALMRALLEAPGGRVQWVFVADWLKQALLTEAARTGASESLLERMDAVLHQPLDALPHDDHFHVRLFCSPQDRLHGCLDRGPRRAWVPFDDQGFESRVQSLITLLRADEPKIQKRGLAALADLEAGAALPHFIQLLDAPVATVRTAALAALRRVWRMRGANDSPARIALTLRLQRTSDPALFRTLISLWAQSGPKTVTAARDALRDPKTLVQTDLGVSEATTIQLRAIELLRDHDRGLGVPALIDALGDAPSAVSVAAHDALLSITNQPMTHPASTGPPIARWGAYWDAHSGDTWLHRMRKGFEARGLVFPNQFQAVETVKRLIDALPKSSGAYRANIVRTLAELTGHRTRIRGWRRGKLHRHWTRWWARYGTELVIGPKGPPSQ